MEISLFSFGLLALIIVMTPGPTVLLALSNGSRFGMAYAGYGIAGAAISDGVLIAAAALGLGAVLITSAVLFNLVKWIGVAYLVWLGIQMLRSSGELGLETNRANVRCAIPGRRALAIFRKSFFVAVTNPKGYLFFTAFLPQFLNPMEPLLTQYARLAGIFIAIDVMVMTAYAGLGTKAMQLLNDSGSLWIDRTCGALLVSLGCALALVRHSDV
ncbi:LysE family translocator [Ruegeria arenilitoris]|uniref:LysE family translocator n=1 Tax=Ruegeria arenilitoris TaxID=1173585 RepID=UPI00147EF069|nr:LysE family translocator [Ruegeria arenilitoris]